MFRLLLCAVLAAAPSARAYEPPTLNVNFFLTQADFSAGCAENEIPISSLSCPELVSSPVVGPAFLWVVLSSSEPFINSSTIGGVTGIQFGIEHDLDLPSDSWIGCNTGLEIPTDAWPDSGSGNAVTWAPCRSSLRPSTVVGFFLVSDATSGNMSLMPDPRTGRIEITDCDNRSWRICPENVGSVDLTLGTVPECGDFAPDVAPPGDLTATVIGCDVELSWNHDGADIIGFEIARDGEFLTVVDADTRSYTDAPERSDTVLYTVASRPSCGAANASSDVAIDAAPDIQAAGDLTASDDNCGAILLTWTDNAVGETGFQIYRNGSHIATQVPDGTSYSDSNAPADTPVDYQVVVVGPCGPGAPSNIATGVLLSPALAPEDLEATQDLCDAIELTWNDRATNETEILISRDDETIATLPPDTETYTDTDIVPGQEYTYIVFAVGPCGGVGSNVATGRSDPDGPPAPTAVSASESSCEFIRVSWEDASADELGFRISRDAQEIATVAPDVVEYVDLTAEPEVTYLYSVTAFNPCGESAAGSDEGTRLVDGGPVTEAPIPLTPGEGETCVPRPVVFTWQAIGNAGSYDVEVFDACGGNVVATASTAQTTVEISVPNGPLAWRVRGVNVCGDMPGPWSPCRTFESEPVLTAPTLFVYESSTDVWTFEWSPVEGAEGYLLFFAPEVSECFIPELATRTFAVAGTDTTFSGDELDPAFVAWVAAFSCGPDLGPPSNCEFVDTTGGSTPVVLDYFRGRPEPGRIVTEWATGHEQGIRAFTLHRESAAEPRRQITQPIPAGSGTYAYVDASVTPGVMYTYTLIEIDDRGDETDLARTDVTAPAAAARLALRARPNPFNPRVTLTLHVPSAGRAVVDLLDASGQLVRRLIDANLDGGVHTHVWDGTDAADRRVASGVYFARLRVSGDSTTRRLVLLR